MGKVLIVDDSEDIRVLLEMSLVGEGYSVQQAENGLVAQQIVNRDKNPCLILLDLMMPVMNGQEFLKWKNTQVHLNTIPVVVISAQPDYNLEGTVGCLKKPVSLNTIFDLVAKYCHVV